MFHGYKNQILQTNNTSHSLYFQKECSFAMAEWDKIEPLGGSQIQYIYHGLYNSSYIGLQTIWDKLHKIFLEYCQRTIQAHYQFMQFYFNTFQSR